MARRSKLSRLFFRVLILAVIAGAAFMGMAFFRAGPAPQINMEADLPGIGKRTPICVMFNETKRGLSNLKVELIQGDRTRGASESLDEPRAARALGVLGRARQAGGAAPGRR